jgi:NADH:ubiquinone oxidoreductase subunit 6 (subunit J)
MVPLLFADFVLDAYWPVAVSVFLGLAMYVLLPRPRPYSPWLGGVCAAVALLLAGQFLIWGHRLSAETVLFYAFAAVSVIFGGLLVTQRNPVHAALSFAVVVLGTCGLFLLQAAPFLMAATIIVYAGAIVVTFLFVIMLAQQSGMSDADHRSREPFLSALGSSVLLVALLYLLNLTYDTRNADQLLQRTTEARERLAETTDMSLDLESLFADFDREAKAHSRLPDKTRLQDAVAKARGYWKDLQEALEGKPTPEETREALANMEKALENLQEVGRQFRDTYGNLQPHGNGPEKFSGFSGPRANQPFHTLRRDEDGHAVMPAENVAAVGRSLFTDYLVPVELAGMLLLVATIGAIAISSRRTGGLR